MNVSRYTVALCAGLVGCGAELGDADWLDVREQQLSAAGAAAPAATTSVTLRFRGRVGSAAFACGTTYTKQGSTKVSVTPQDFRFFVQNVRLIRSDGVQTPVQMATRAPWQNPDVALVDFENRKGSCVEGNPETNTIITGTVPSGTYNGVAFTTGVPQNLNHQNPTTLAAPLSTYSGLTWGWLTGFRFVKAELRQTGQGALGQGLLHVGSTGCSGSPQAGTVRCVKPNRNDIKLTGFNHSTNYIAADIGAMLAMTDLSQDSQCHGTGAVCSTTYPRVGINFSNGQPSTGQVAFRVE